MIQILGASIAVPASVAAASQFTGISEPSLEIRAFPEHTSIQRITMPVYGPAKLHGATIFVNSYGPGSEMCELMTLLSGHRLKSIDQIRFDDRPVEIDLIPGRAAISRSHGETVSFESILGQKPGQRFFFDTVQHAHRVDLLGNAVTFSYNHLIGKSLTYLRLKYDENIYPTGIPHISYLVHGKDDIFDPRSGACGYSDNAALCMADLLRSLFGTTTRTPYGGICMDSLCDTAARCAPLPLMKYSPNMSPLDILQLLATAGNMDVRYEDEQWLFSNA